MPDLVALLSLIRRASRDRTPVVLVNIGLRYQLTVYKRSVGPGRLMIPMYQAKLASRAWSMMRLDGWLI